MNILLASSEVAPFSKTGGLADVTGALPAEIARSGHRCIVMTPAYRQVYDCGQPIEPTGVVLEIPIGGKIVTGRLLKSQMPDSDVEVYLVAQDDYFDRSNLYQIAGEDYKDNCERFVFFCRAVMESIRLLDLDIDVLHVNDWQTALIPAYLRTEYAQLRRYANIATLFTIHNLAYQGQFWHWDMLLTGLDWKYFNWRQMEFYGQLNLMKAGIAFADSINTVSPRYAREIQTHEYGCGLQNVLQHRSGVLSGILNGVDYNEWNPAIDRNIAENYTVETWPQGKAECKKALQEKVGLPHRDGAPLIGVVTRLADQKGLDLIGDVLEYWVRENDVQWVFLGTGDQHYHRMLGAMAENYPNRVAAVLKFDYSLAHQIEAGSDIFLMPSKFEPCGLNQMYSLRYGTVPVVRETGGLADTIIDATPENMTAGTANGFSFRDYASPPLDVALRRAVQMYHDPAVWARLVETGMRQDLSWSHSAKEYIALYETTITRVREKVDA